MRIHNKEELRQYLNRKYQEYENKTSPGIRLFNQGNEGEEYVDAVIQSMQDYANANNRDIVYTGGDDSITRRSHYREPNRHTLLPEAPRQSSQRPRLNNQRTQPNFSTSTSTVSIVVLLGLVGLYIFWQILRPYTLGENQSSSDRNNFRPY